MDGAATGLVRFLDTNRGGPLQWGARALGAGPPVPPRGPPTLPAVLPMLLPWHLYLSPFEMGVDLGSREGASDWLG